MSVIGNARHERFAQEVAAGKSATEAYVVAGYSGTEAAAAVSASRLLKNANVRQRISEIQAEAAKRAGITVEKVIAELAKIGFADIRRAVEWRGSLTREQDNPDGGDVLVIKEIFSNHVRLLDSDKIDDATAAAIAEVKQSPTGGLSIKFHDKQAALVNLGKHLGMFVEKHELTGKDGEPLAPPAPTIIIAGRPDAMS